MPPNTTYSGWGGQLHSPVGLLKISEEDKRIIANAMQAYIN
jgi:hypothetical protein